ncbi:MAG: COG1470 family protein [Candidatus Aquicultorales bacterium]
MQKIKLFILTIMALSFLSVSASPAFARMAIGIDPAKFEYSLKSGETVNGTITVTNEGDEPLDHVSLYVANIGITDGKADYVRPTGYEDPRRSPASWVLLSAPDRTKAKDNIPYVSLEKGGSVEVDFSIKIPDNLRPGDHNILIFFEAKQPSKGGTTIGGRLGAKIKIRTPGELVEKMAIDKIDFPSIVFGGAADFNLTLTNKGNVDLKPKVSLAVMEGARSTQRQSLREVYLYVGAKADTKGRYVFENMPAVRKVVVTAADGSVSAKRELTVFVVPWWVAGAAGGLMLLVGSFLAGRRRGKRVVANGEKFIEKRPEKERKQPKSQPPEEEKVPAQVTSGPPSEIMPEIAEYRKKKDE